MHDISYDIHIREGRRMGMDRVRSGLNAFAEEEKHGFRDPLEIVCEPPLMVMEPKKRAYECRPTTPQTNPSTRPTSTSSSNRRTHPPRRGDCPCCRGWRRCRPGSPRRPRRPHRPRCRPRSTCRSRRRTRRRLLRWVSFSLRLIDSLIFFHRQILFNRSFCFCWVGGKQGIVYKEYR